MDSEGTDTTKIYVELPLTCTSPGRTVGRRGIQRTHREKGPASMFCVWQTRSQGFSKFSFMYTGGEGEGGGNGGAPTVAR